MNFLFRRFSGVFPSLMANLGSLLSWVPRRLVTGIVAVCTVYVGFGLVLYFNQDGMLFHPGLKDWRSCDPNSNAVTSFEVPSVKSDRVWRGWKVSTSSPRGRLLLFHGNAGLACHRFFYREFFERHNFELVLFEYPGYDGTSLSAEAILQGALEVYDHFSGLSTLPTFALGESLGSGVATYLAAHRELNGLILFAPYTSITEIAQHRIWFYPVSWLLRSKFPAEDWAPFVDEAVFAFQGTSDSVIPHSLSLRQSANFKKIQFFPIQGADHNDWTEFVNEDFLSALGSFVERQLTQGEPP